MPSLIPKSSYESRPTVALEIRPEVVVGARATDGSGALAQVAQAWLPEGSVQPGLRAQNVTDPAAVTAAVRQVLAPMQTGKLRDVTLIVPDASVRVILLDFDTLPGDTEEALAVVRFRLTRLLPFPADAARISYQVMGERARQVQVLTVAMPSALLAEYESAVRNAGFEPGAVLPSTLAALGALDEAAEGAANMAALLVNCGAGTLTTAIVRRGELLLHRTLDTAPPQVEVAALPAESTVIVVPGLSTDSLYVSPSTAEYGADDPTGAEVGDGPVVESFVPARALAEAEAADAAAELQQALAVAIAYYEDSLAAPPARVLTAGTMSAQEIGVLLDGSGIAARELLEPSDLLSTATASISPGLLAGVRGALRNNARPAVRTSSRWRRRF